MTVDFQAFIRGIHAAITSANDALAEKNLELLQTYFEPAMDSDESPDPVDAAIDATQELIQDRMGEQAREAQKALEELRTTLRGQSAGSRKPNASLRPRMVSMQYPQQTADGARMVDINVPLVTLVPVSQSRIESLTLRATLNLSVDSEDKLRVGFSPSTAGADGDAEAQLGTATLEITVRPDEGSAGLKRLIEGYERVLRAQIPS